MSGSGDRTAGGGGTRSLEARLREAARQAAPGRSLEDLEVRHLARVVNACSLLLTDVYSDERIARIMQPDRTLLSGLVGRLIEEQRRGSGEVLYRVRRLPDDVRVVGDKALFDVGLLGRRRVKGLDLDDLGVRAYLAASEALRLLAEDRRLREFFTHNKMLMLPLEDEVGFLKQCSERFPLHAEILRHLHGPDVLEGSGMRDLEREVPIMAAAADALLEMTETPQASVAAPAIEAACSEEPDAYTVAARDASGVGAGLPPNELLSAYERMVLFAALDAGRIRAALAAVVVDQDEAVEALCDEFTLFASGTRDLGKPTAYFLVGPTGVGKNHLVESLRRLLEGLWRVEIPMLTIEGPSYTYPSDINDLKGATRGFIRSDEEGLLTVFHARSSRAPLGIILVDEVEKAHGQLRTFFLSILDRGTTTDNRGHVLNFANTIVFFTSNLGYSDAQQRSAPIGFLDDENRQGAVDHDIRTDLKRALSPEFVNRVRLIHFARLTRSSAEKILDLEVEKIARRYREVHGIDLELDPSARGELLALGFSPLFGARQLAATLEAVCNVAISKKIRVDDRRAASDRDALVAWLRDLRAQKAAFDPDQVRRRVLEVVRADLDYDAVRIAHDGEDFVYRPVRRNHR